jgi:hypothetical protein
MRRAFGRVHFDKYCLKNMGDAGAVTDLAV